jgi:integrase
MAKYTSVYKRKGSPYWWVMYLDPKTGKRKGKATNHRLDAPMGRRKAQDEANELSRETKAFTESAPSERWESWVDDFLAMHYRNSAKSYARARGAWSQWRVFLTDRKIIIPRALDYQAVEAFVYWRQAQLKRNGDPVSINTALCDVRICSVAMGEALKRGWCNANPCAKLGIKKDDPDEKPEITAAEENDIREALPAFVAQDPEMYGHMVNSFEIAIHQGCRLRETEVQLTDIDTSRRTITFRAKGRKVFATQLHPKLIPVIEKLRAAGERVTCKIPMLASKHWRDFFDQIDLPHLCFHCTRVTVITRLARAGVPISQAMSFVGHASRLIHRIYTRLQPGDLSLCIAALA